MTTGRVLVVGGGIGGFAAMRALRHRGIPAVLVERAPRPPDGALGVNLPGNAVQALRTLGLSQDLPGLGEPIRRREYRNARGRLLFAIDEAAFWGDLGPSLCVQRADLISRLGADLPSEAVRWGTTVVGVTSTSDDVQVRLRDGRTEAYDLVIGADGVHSAVRAATFGSEQPRAALLSATSWRFVVPNPGVDCWTVWSDATGTFLLIPVDADAVYGYASASRGGTAGAGADWLETTFSGFPEPVRRAVAAIANHAVPPYHSPVEEVRLPRWSSRRVVLIGDAAHATAPVWAQGAALAVEDAVVLADLLAHGADWSGAGDEYERRRRPRVAHVQRMTDRMSRLAALPSWLRDTIAPFAGPRTYQEAYAPLRHAP